MRSVFGHELVKADRAIENATTNLSIKGVPGRTHPSTRSNIDSIYGKVLPGTDDLYILEQTSSARQNLAVLLERRKVMFESHFITHFADWTIVGKNSWPARMIP